MSSSQYLAALARLLTLLVRSIRWVANVDQAPSTLQDAESSNAKCGPESDSDVSLQLQLNVTTKMGNVLTQLLDLSQCLVTDCI
jgi:hypothetical protein